MLKLVRFMTIDAEEVYVNPAFVVTVRQTCPSSDKSEGICRVTISTTATFPSQAEEVAVRGELEEVVARLEGGGHPVTVPPMQYGDWTRHA